MLGDLHATPTTVVGPSAPLPVGAQLRNPFTGERVAEVLNEDTWLFFGFGPLSGFTQPHATWVLADGQNGHIEIILGQDTYPEVIDGDDRVIALNFAAGSTLGKPFFNAGAWLREVPVDGPGTSTPVSDDDDTDFSGQSLTGDVKADCEEIKKIAILIQLDDNSSDPLLGSPKPQFDKVIDTEKALLKTLGVNAISVIRPGQIIAKPNVTDQSGRDLVKGIVSHIEKVMEDVTDCCTEVLIFVNGHQNKQGVLQFRAKPTGKYADKSPHKGRMDAAVLAKAVAKAMAKRQCVPVALIYHSCYSGRLKSSAITAALESHSNFSIFASSSEAETTKASRTSVDEYFFLSALGDCLVEEVNGVKRLRSLNDDDAWKCIEKRTQELLDAYVRKMADDYERKHGESPSGWKKLTQTPRRHRKR